MSYIYLLIDLDRNIGYGYHMVKVGITSDTYDDLIARYNLYIPNVEILLYEKCSNAKQIQDKILNMFYDKRIRNNKQNDTEWLRYHSMGDDRRLCDILVEKIERMI